jgi:hypothetical protein
MTTPQMVPALLVEDDVNIMEEGDDDDDPVIILPKQLLHSLIRQRSSSTPDFISLERKMSMAEDDAEQQDIIRHYGNNPALDSYQHHPRPISTKPRNASAWTGRTSFRDMVLSQVQDLANEVTASLPPGSAKSADGVATTTTATKPKPKIVVMTTTRMRKYESSPNLYGLASSSYSTSITTTTTRATASSTDDEDLILGDTDAMEYYHRKAKGVTDRKNGMKLRPDEAKRRDIVMYKKGLQRQQQQQQQPSSTKASKASKSSKASK